MRGMVVMDKKDTILDTLEQSKHPLNISEMADILGFEQTEILSVIQELEKNNQVVRPRGNYYTITS